MQERKVPWITWLKQCPKCGETKESDQFHIDATRRDGRSEVMAKRGWLWRNRITGVHRQPHPTLLCAVSGCCHPVAWFLTPYAPTCPRLGEGLARMPGSDNSRSVGLERPRRYGTTRGHHAHPSTDSVSYALP